MASEQHLPGQATLHAPHGEPRRGPGAPATLAGAASEAACRALFDASMDAVLLVGPDEGVLRANALACELFGRTDEQMRLPGQARQLFAAQDQHLDALLRECRARGRAEGVLTALRADGTLFAVRVCASHYTLAGGEPRTMFVLRELGAGPAINAHCGEQHPARCMRESARELRAANAELKRFAHALAHELRTPIDAVVGFGKVLERELGTPERARHYLARIRAAGLQLDEYVQALLSLARLAQAPMRVGLVDLSALARTVLAELQLRDPTRAVATRVQDGLHAHGDARLLKVVLENLLGNAWKFTGRQRLAEITFCARPGPDGEPVFQVQDNGAGFDMAYVGKLFGDFQRLHTVAEFPGAGVGLANVQRIVTRHSGRVWAESVDGAGATFFFTLGGTPPAPAAGRRCERCAGDEPLNLITPLLPVSECCDR